MIILCYFIDIHILYIDKEHQEVDISVIEEAYYEVSVTIGRISTQSISVAKPSIKSWHLFKPPCRTGKYSEISDLQKPS